VPASLNITAGVTVPAEPDQVWDLVVDWSRQREWIWATRTAGGHGAGASVIGRTGIGPVGFTDPMVITGWDPPRRCVLAHTGRLVRGTGIFEVAPRGPGSRFRWTEQLELPVPPAVGALASRVIPPLAEWGLRSCLRRFARLLAPS
jgi:carbon monoxide dehydrogenase subunit G